MAILPFRKVNAAIKMWEGKCDIPFWLYIEMAFPALLTMLFRYGTFGQSDMIRMGIGKSQSKWTNRLFNKLKPYSPRHNFNGLKFFWKIDGILQRVFFAWLVIDILMDGFYRYTTLVHQAGNCTPDPGGGTFQRANNGGGLFISNLGWGAFFCPIPQQNSDNWLGSSADVNLPPGKYLAIAGLTCHVHPDEIDETPSLQIRLKLTGTTFSQNWKSGDAIPIGPGPTGLLVQTEFTVPEGSIYRLVWEQHGDMNTVLVYDAADIMVTRMGEIEVIGGS